MCVWVHSEYSYVSLHYTCMYISTIVEVVHIFQALCVWYTVSSDLMSPFIIAIVYVLVRV